MFRHVKRGGASADDPVMRYSPRDRGLVVTSYNPETRKQERVKATGEILLDFGSARHGHERLQRGQSYGIHLVPITDPMPEPPDDGYLPVGAILAIAAGMQRRADLIVDHDDFADELSEFYCNVFEPAYEAMTGQIPLVQMNAMMELELTGWCDRDERYLGKRLIPPPAGNQK